MSASSHDAAVQLRPMYDVARLQADLARLVGFDRVDEPYREPGHIGFCLIGPGGDAGSASSITAFQPPQPTAALAAAPYLQEVLDSLPCPKNSARIMYLERHTKLAVHTDAPCNFQTGILRLHVPIITNRQVVMGIEDRQYFWGEGELWWGDFSLPHYVENNSPIDRAHLIVDAFITEELLELFPAEFAARRRDEGVLFYEPPVTLRPEQLAAFACEVELPPGALPRTYDDGRFHERAGRARIEVADDVLVLTVGGERALQLVPVSETTASTLGEGPCWKIEVAPGAGAERRVTILRRGGVSQPRRGIESRRLDLVGRAI